MPDLDALEALGLPGSVIVLTVDVSDLVESGGLLDVIRDGFGLEDLVVVEGLSVVVLGTFGCLESSCTRCC